MTPLGFVVLSRRPNPYTENGWDYTVESVAFPNPGLAESARRQRELQKPTCSCQFDDCVTKNDPVEYVVASMKLYEQKPKPLCDRCGRPQSDQPPCCQPAIKGLDE